MLTHLPPTIVIVERNSVIRATASNILERNGFDVRAVSDEEAAMKLIQKPDTYQKPNIIIVGSELKNTTGIEFCKELKSSKLSEDIPIVLILDQGGDFLKSSVEKINDVPFDDYIEKDFVQSDLMSKIKGILLRFKSPLRSKILIYQDIKMDISSYKVTKNCIEVHLGPTEFKILRCFVEEPSRIFSRQDLIEQIWGIQENIELRTIDVHINRLRTALKQPYENIPLIKTVRSSGYCLELPRSK